MLEDIIKYNTALKLNEIGFDEFCWFPYDKDGNICNNEYVMHNIKYNQYDFKIFDVEDAHYMGIKAPSQLQVTKWFRKVHGINIESNYLPNIKKYRALFIPMKIIPKTFKSASEHYMTIRKYLDTTNFDEYEEALELGILKAIEIVKSRNKQNETKE